MSQNQGVRYAHPLNNIYELRSRMQAVKVAKRIPDGQPMCIFWRLQGGTAEFYMEDDPEATEDMLDDYARYFRDFGRYWWANGGLSLQERNERDYGGWVRVENLVELGGVLMYYQNVAYQAAERTLASTNSSQGSVPSLRSQYTGYTFSR